MLRVFLAVSEVKATLKETRSSSSSSSECTEMMMAELVKSTRAYETRLHFPATK